MKIALVQMKIQDGAVADNLARAAELIQAHPGADLYLLPELWTSGYQHASWAEAAQANLGVLKNFQDIACDFKACIGGSLVLKNDADALVNRFCLVSPQREKTITYDKMHLFPPMKEDEFMARGKKRVNHVIGEWNVGLSLCYDLRFPAMYRKSALEGVNLFLVVCQWPKARAAVMRLLAQARAAENQAYLVLCNRTGFAEDGTEFGGGSGIWGPDGETLVELGDAEDVTQTFIDSKKVAHLRHDFPVFAASVQGLDF